jgi:hypothetical protein
MPNRAELAIPAMRASTVAAAEDAWAKDAWLIVGICATGLILSLYLAVGAVPSDQIPTLIAQVPWG